MSLKSAKEGPQILSPSRYSGAGSPYDYMEGFLGLFGRDHVRLIMDLALVVDGVEGLWDAGWRHGVARKGSG